MQKQKLILLLRLKNNMTHEETIQRIQELVPSVMALEFGCEVMYEWENGEKSKMTRVRWKYICFNYTPKLQLHNARY